MLGWKVDSVRRQREAIAELERMGVAVHYDIQDANLLRELPNLKMDEEREGLKEYWRRHPELKSD